MLILALINRFPASCINIRSLGNNVETGEDQLFKTLLTYVSGLRLHIFPVKKKR